MKFGVSDFFEDVFHFIKSGSAMGVDFGTTSLKVAELRVKKGKFFLENYGILETKNYFAHPNQAIQTSSLKLVEKEAVALLKILLEEMKIKTKTVIAAIPSFASFVTTIDMPALSKEETARSIMFQARQFIPLPVSAVSVDWFKIEEFEEPKVGKFQRILLIGIPNEIIRKYKNIFSALGLKLVALEVESLALVRALIGKSDEAVTLIVDIGTESTNIVVTERGVLKYNSQSDFGSVYLSQALARSLGLSLTRAEELKRRRGLLGSGGEFELSTLMIPFLDVIIQEVRRAKESFERRYSKRVEALILTGGGANLLGIENYFAKQLNLRLTASTPIAAIGHPVLIEPVIKELGNILPVAIGLAKRYFI